MISRLVRNFRAGSSALVLALLACALLVPTGDAVGKSPHYVDGHGMATADGTENPWESGGGGSMEGDPWGGEQRDAGDAGSDGPTIVETLPTTSSPLDAFRFADLWSILYSFWASLWR